MAGIPIFVTGGIGGVHRGGEESMDVSADLCELGRTPVMVVSAGAKSILDIPRTLEFLETQGVCVLALGTDEFPAFFTRTSGVPAPARVDSSLEAAAVAHAQKRLGLESGMLVGVPIPEKDEANAAVVQAAIDTALAEASAQGVSGRAITPFLLGRIAELSKGASLASNIALIKNNARIGAEIAVELTRLRRSQDPSVGRGGLGGRFAAPPLTAAATPAIATPAAAHREHRPTEAVHAGSPVVVGGSVVDVVCCPDAGTELLPQTSNPGRLEMSPGGVGRNVAEGLARLGTRPLLISAIGTDGMGSHILEHLEGLAHAGAPMQTVGVRRVGGCRTATYTAMMDARGDLSAAVADMAANDLITPDHVTDFAEAIRGTSLCIADANLAEGTLIALARLAASHGIPLWLEPTSVPKARRTSEWLHAAGLLSALTFVSPNAEEALAMAASIHGEPTRGDEDSDLAVRAAASTLVRAGIAHVFVTRGERGVLWARRATAEAGVGTTGRTGVPGAASDVRLEELPALDVGAALVSTRGAGDSFVAGTAWGLHEAAKAHEAVDADAIRAAVRAGLRAAQMSLLSEEAVPSTLCHTALTAGPEC